MSQLGEVLEILFGPSEPFETVRATIHHERDDAAAKEASRADKMLYGRRKLREKVEAHQAETSTETTRVWLKSPASAQIQREYLVRGVLTTTLTVTDGNRRWECDLDGHVDTKPYDAHDRDPCGMKEINIAVDRHFRPTQIRRFLEHLKLTPIGPTRTADRDCIAVAAASRGGAGLWPHWLPLAADEYLFHFDLERAVLLTVIARCGNWCQFTFPREDGLWGEGVN